MSLKIIKGEHTYGDIKGIGKVGTIKIGKFCSLGGNIQAITVGHRADFITTYPFQELYKELNLTGHPTVNDITIGNDVWIGNGVTVLGGSVIGDGCCIGAGSVVSGKIRPYSIAIGNRAKEVKERFSEEKALMLIKIAWWDWPIEKILANAHLLCDTNIDKFMEKHFKWGRI